MGSSVVKGLRIVVDGDEKPFNTAMGRATEKVKETRAEVSALRKSLSAEWDSKTFVEAQRAASEAVQATNKKVEILKTSLQKVRVEGADSSSEEIKYLTVELVKAETAAKQAANTMQSVAGMEFNRNLSSANSNIAKTTQMLDAMKSKLSLNSTFDNNTFVKAQQLAQEAIEKTEDKVRLLRREIISLNREGITDANRDKVSDLKIEFHEASNAATLAKKEFADIVGMEFSRNLSSANSDIAKTTQMLDAMKSKLNSSTGFDNATFAKTQQIAREAVEQTTSKMKLLQKEIDNLNSQGINDSNKDRLKDLNIELLKTQNAAQQAEQELQSVAGMEFNRNLSSANSEIAKTTKNLEEMKTKLSSNNKWVLDKNDFAESQKLAREAVEQTTDKVKLFRDEIAKLNREGITDTNHDKLENLNNELVETQKEATKAKKQLEEINQAQLDRVIGKLNDIGNTMLKTGAGLTAGVTMPIAYLGKQALDTASNLVEVQNVVDTAFGDASAGKINKWSQSLLDSHGISELTAKQNAGLFKDMANGMDIADDAGTKMATTLTELMGDVASYKNLSLEQVSNKLKSVYTGETESLKELGVVMTEENLNAFALKNGMKALSDEMTQAEKVNLRYEFVLNSLSGAQGDFAKTQDSLANQTRLAQERFKSLAADLARELLPIATDLMEWVNDCIKSFSEMSDEQKKATLIVIGLAAGLGPVVTLLGGIVKGCQLGATAWKAITTAIAVYKSGAEATTVSQKILNAVMSANPYAIVATAILALGVATTAYVNANDEVIQKTKELNKALDENSEKYSSSAKSAEDNANSQLAEIDLAERLIARYDELNGNADLLSDEKFELSQIVSELNSLLGEEIILVNQGTNEYSMQTSGLRSLISARKEEIQLIALREKAISAQKALIEINEKIPDAEENYNKANEQKESHNDWGSFWITVNDKNKVKDAEKIYQELLKEKEKLEKQIESYTSYQVSPESVTWGMTQQQAQKYAEGFMKTSKLPREELEKLFTEDKGYLEYLREYDVISEQEYYDELIALRTKYYGVVTDDYENHTQMQRRLNTEILNLEKTRDNERTANSKQFSDAQSKAAKEAYEKQKDIAKDAYDANKKLLEEAYDAEKKEMDEHFKYSKQVAENKYKSDKKLLEESYKANKQALEDNYKAEVKAIEDAYKAKEKLIQDQIKAIDEEIEARNRLKKEEEFDGQIQDIQNQLSFGKMDEFTRKELEAELKRLTDEKADYEWELEQEQRKEALNEELNNAKELADQQKQASQELFEQKKIAMQEEYDKNIEYLETSYQLNMKQLEDTYNLNTQQLEQTYQLNSENLEKAYNSHIKHLETVFSKSSNEMGKISKDFVNTINKGCREAASILGSIVNDVSSMVSQVESNRMARGGTTSYDYSQRTVTVNPPSGVTEAQVQRMIDRVLY